MLTDTGALMLAFVATRMARRPADEARSYGYARAEVLAAFANGIVMIGVVLWIVVEAAGRIMEPSPVMGAPMLVIAVAGLIVNIVAFKLLHGGESNLNMRGAALHVMGDMLGSVAAIAAAGIIIATGYTIADPILSVLVALLILKSAIGITKESAHILMEGTPDGVDGETIADDLVENVPGLCNVHHVHAWSLGSNRAVATSISASASHRFRSSHTSEWYLPAPRATARSLSEKSIPHTRLSSPASTPALLRLSACKPSAHPTSKTRAPRFGRRTAPARIARTNASVASSGQRYPHSRTVRL